MPLLRLSKPVGASDSCERAAIAAVRPAAATTARIGCLIIGLPGVVLSASLASAGWRGLYAGSRFLIPDGEPESEASNGLSEPCLPGRLEKLLERCVAEEWLKIGVAHERPAKRLKPQAEREPLPQQLNGALALPERRRDLSLEELGRAAAIVGIGGRDSSLRTQSTVAVAQSGTGDAQLCKVDHAADPGVTCCECREDCTRFGCAAGSREHSATYQWCLVDRVGANSIEKTRVPRDQTLSGVALSAGSELPPYFHGEFRLLDQRVPRRRKPRDCLLHLRHSSEPGERPCGQLAVYRGLRKSPPPGARHRERSGPVAQLGSGDRLVSPINWCDEVQTTVGIDACKRRCRECRLLRRQRDAGQEERALLRSGHECRETLCGANGLVAIAAHEGFQMIQERALRRGQAVAETLGPPHYGVRHGVLEVVHSRQRQEHQRSCVGRIESGGALKMRVLAAIILSEIRFHAAEDLLICLE